MDYRLEICCYNIQSCLTAQAAGAHRIELCANPAEGGTTPSYGMIRTVKEKTRIDVYPIVRPRGGDFLYTEEEYDIIKKDILVCKDLHCEGIVIGMLQADGAVDKKRVAKLVALAYPMGVIFHRAFDRAANPFEALNTIIDTGCERILTSGQRPHAVDAVSLLNELVRQADDHISIMPGSGVRASNITMLAQQTGAHEFHSSAAVTAQSQMQYVQEGMHETLQYIAADKNEIEGMLHALSLQAAH